MKYFVYIVLAFVAGFLFLPQTGTTEIRNKPLLILIISAFLIRTMIRLVQYAILMIKTKKVLKQNRMRLINSSFVPWASFFRGQYSISFQGENKTVQIVLMSRKKYQRYHFDSIGRLEFYRSNRVVFRSSRVKGATISNLVENNRVGKQKIKWEDSAELRILLFDKLPDIITDSVKKECLGTGDRICSSNIYLLDFTSFVRDINLLTEQP